eukprot:2168002-Alexandrium_andersonii.AAC.1
MDISASLRPADPPIAIDLSDQALRADLPNVTVQLRACNRAAAVAIRPHGMRRSLEALAARWLFSIPGAMVLMQLLVCCSR